MSATAALVALTVCTIPRLSAPMCSFIPKCQFLPLRVCFISGSRVACPNGEPSSISLVGADKDLDKAELGDHNLPSQCIATDDPRPRGTVIKPDSIRASSLERSVARVC